ncbi:MAG: TPM domain-containing protein [Erysipelotrichaceae bacterium]|nr:TPM domain-containing protein [Erysipelotrichaceae bacterium]
MKKILSIIFITALFLLTPLRVAADNEHVIINNDDDLISVKKIADLNEDLHRIEQNYDVSIYFVYDTSIADSESEVGKYAKSFLDKHSPATNNVVMVLAEHYYRILAAGPQADLISNNEDKLWNAFYSKATNSSPDAFGEGIKDYYQLALKLINSEAYTSTAPTVTGNPLVNDYADLLSDKEEASLYAKLRQVADKHGIDVVAVTTNSTNGKPVEDYADDFYDYNGYKKDGVIFVLDMGEREIYISTSGKCKEYMTDYGIDQIFDDMMSDLADGQYYDALVTYAKETDSLLTSAENGQIVDVNNDTEPDRFGAKNFVISAIGGAIASLFSSLILRGRMKSVHSNYYAGDYIVGNSFVLTGASDMLVDRHVSRAPIRREETRLANSHSSGSSGGSHIHTSSSGTSHGGHGRHF